jgi:hypothetical protein
VPLFLNERAGHHGFRPVAKTVLNLVASARLRNILKRQAGIVVDGSFYLNEAVVKPALRALNR